MNSVRLWPLMLTFGLCAVCTPLGRQHVGADELTLQSGGSVRGDVINHQASTEHILMRTEAGITLKLARSQVAGIHSESPAEAEYRRRAPLVADTVDDQWKLAEWCRVNRLREQRRVHLLRIIDHDPDHAKARHALGYSFVNGQWRLPESWQRSEGYVRYRGRWRTAQEIELMKTREQREKAQRHWLARIKRLRKSLSSDRAAEARQQILAIRDSHAVYALSENLEKERYRAVKLLYVKVLAQIGDSAAFKTLIETSLNDPDEEVFQTCADAVVDRPPPFAVAAYIKGLKDPNNVRVNRSAQVLARLDAREAFVPLIEALVTVHTVSRGLAGGRSADSMTTTFVSPGNSAAQATVPSGGTSFTAGNQAQVISLPIQNQAVLAALVQLSDGASFGFNKQAWTNWHAASRRRPVVVDGRRSE